MNTAKILGVFSLCIVALTGCYDDTKEIAKSKAQTVITTDGEVDDMDSMIRFFYYANEVDLKGIVLTSSKYHYAGDSGSGIEPFRWTGTDWITEFTDQYASIYENLKVHADGFPSPSYIASVTKIGNITNVGEMEKITEGSEFLKQLFLEDTSQPLYVQTWGGTNTTARALKSIQEEYENTKKWDDIKKAVSERVIIYIILDQDDSYSNYIAVEWPNIKIINDRSNFWHFAYAWPMNPKQVNTYLDNESWLYNNFKINHGSLLESYVLMGDGQILKGELADEQRGSSEYVANSDYEQYDFIAEGDSPSFFYLIDNGLRSMEDPSYGGWGGRFGAVSDKLYNNSVLDYDPYTNQYESHYSLMRWFDDIQLDFAARADWGVAEKYEDANHYPEVTIKEGVDIVVSPGAKITLHAVANDPDGDNLFYKWWHYFEADTYKSYTGDKPEEVESFIGVTRQLADDEKVPTGLIVAGADTDTVTINVPKDAVTGDTFHIIAEVQDDSSAPLKRYQRVILTVKTAK